MIITMMMKVNLLERCPCLSQYKTSSLVILMKESARGHFALDITSKKNIQDHMCGLAYAKMYTIGVRFATNVREQVIRDSHTSLRLPYCHMSLLRSGALMPLNPCQPLLRVNLGKQFIIMGLDYMTMWAEAIAR